MRLPTEVKTGPISLLIRDCGAVTSEWLSELFEEPTKLVNVSPVGAGYMASTYRVKYEDKGGAPGSVVVKLASQDAGSRGFGISSGSYQRETDFYAHLGAKIAAKGVIPASWLSICDADGWFTLVMEDIVDGEVGEQMTGFDLSQIRRALDAHATFTAPFVNSPEVGDATWVKKPTADGGKVAYQQLYPSFLKRYEKTLAPKYLELVEWLGDHAGELFDVPLGTLDSLIHVDFRPDNIMFTPSRTLTFDFQGAGYGLLLHDVSYLLGGCCTPEFRKKHEVQLVKEYVEKVQELTTVKIDWDLAFWQYRRQSFMGIWIAVVAGMLCVETERGTEMYRTMTERAAQACLDLNSKEIFETSTPGRLI